MGGVQGNSRVMGQTHAHMDSMYIDRFFFFSWSGDCALSEVSPTLLGYAV